MLTSAAKQRLSKHGPSSFETPRLAQRRFASRSSCPVTVVMPRESGASSTRPLDSIAGVSGILDHPHARVMTAGKLSPHQLIGEIPDGLAIDRGPVPFAQSTSQRDPDIRVSLHNEHLGLSGRLIGLFCQGCL
jgi:hypothetical protein